jgi:anti-sigma factor RsiW
MSTGEFDPAHALELERQLAKDPALEAERERIDTHESRFRELRACRRHFQQYV